MPYLSFLMICCVWGSSFILMDRALMALGPVEIAIARLLSGALVVGFYWYLSGQRARISGRQWAHIGLVAGLSNTLPFVIQPCLLGQGFGHSFFGMMVALVPLATILVSIPMLGIWPNVRQTVGVLGGFFCVAGLIHDGSIRGMPASLLALAILVPVTYAIGNTYIRWKLNDLPAEPLTALFLGLGGLMLLPFGLMPGALERLNVSGPAAPHNWPVALAAISLLGVVGTGITILVFIRLIQSQGPLFAGMVTYLIPIVALLWGLVDGESISRQQIVAIVGVLAMVGLVQWGSYSVSVSRQAC